MCLSRTWVVGLLALIGAGYLGTLRIGHEWGDDFCLYLQHTRNLAEGTSYADTGYLYNPQFPSLSPRLYPPLFPVLLLPAYTWFGLSLPVMKVEEVLFFLAFLSVVYVHFRSELSRGPRLALLACLGLNPYFWDYKDRVLSEMPFLLFAYLALHFIARTYNTERPWRWRWLNTVLAGLCIYLACATRSVGIVLVPCLVLEGWRRERRLFNPALLLAMTICACGVLVQRMLIPVDGSYLDQLVFHPTLFVHNALSLVKAMGLFAANGYSDGLHQGLFLVLTAFALAGLGLRLRTALGVHEFFAVFYGLAIIVWPSSAWNQRFLLPLVPLYAAYVLHGIRAACSFLPRTVSVPVGIGLAAALLASYVGLYTRMEFGTLREGISKPESVALFNYIRDHTSREDVFLFQKPRALALFTDRKASAIQTAASDQELWDYVGQIQATYLIASPLFADSYRRLQEFVQHYPDRWQQVYANQDFAVYRIEPPELDTAPLTIKPAEVSSH